MKTLISGLLALVMAVGVFAPATASAASSWNGVYNSNGKSLNSWNRNYQYSNYTQQQQTLQAYIRQLEQLLAQLRALQEHQYDWDHNYNWDYDWSSNRSMVNVTTRNADNIEDDMATLHGRIDFGSSDEAVVYFQWGTASNRLTEETPNIVLEDNDDEDFSARIDDLDEDRTYYFRAVAEDEDGRLDYGSILSFRSDDDQSNDDDNDSNDEEPNVETLGASNVRTTSAELRGEVDMNDFEDGYVFLVYGEDEDMIDEITDEYDEYQDIDTDGDNLQKTSIYSGLDDYRTFWTTVSGLDEDTDIYYAYCVEYEDEDGDETITCGDTESFTTDED